jgi:hypothetical protein
MPFAYTTDPATTLSTSATPNTEIDCLFLKPGAGAPLYVTGFSIHGKNAAATSITGITMRLKKYGTTAATTGTGVALTNALLTGTIQPAHPSFPLAAATGAYNSTSGATITAGTGGPATQLTIGCGATGPGAWAATSQDHPKALFAGANQSLDWWHSTAGSVSLPLSLSVEHLEY